jgi:hypothetical protein
LADDAVTLSKATSYDVEELIDRMRASDVEELRLLTRQTPEAAVRRSVELSDHPVAVREKTTGELACIYGVAPVQQVGRVGAAWMLGTDTVFKHPRVLVRRTRSVLKSVLNTHYDYLFNVVWDGNEMTKRYLELSGFTLEPVQYTIGGVPYRKFWAERKDYV